MLRASPNALLLALCIALGVALTVVSISPLQQGGPYDYSDPAKAERQHSVPSGTVANAIAQKHPESGKKEGKWYQTFLDHTPDWFVAIFTLLLAYVTYRLVKTTGDLRVSTDKLWEAGERQLITTRSVAAVQARNTRRQLKLAEDTAERQLRAYMSVSQAWVTWHANDNSMEIIVQFKNFGGTPAYNFGAWIVVTMGKVGWPLGKKPDDGTVGSRSIIGPGSLGNSRAQYTDIKPDDLGRIEREEFLILVCGRGTYTDAFGRDRYFAYDMHATGPLSSIRVAGEGAEGWALISNPEGDQAN